MRRLESHDHRLKILFYFLGGNFLLSLWIASPYLDFGPTERWSLPGFYTRLAFVSHFILLIFLVGLLLWPLTRFIRSTVQLWIFPPLVLFLYQTLLLVDVRIFEIFRFHINGLVINTLTTEGASDSVSLGGGTLITTVAVLGLLALAQWGGMGILIRRLPATRRPHPRRRGWRRTAVALGVLILGVVAGDKILFAYANFHEMTQVTRYQKLFPMYQPLFMDETFEKVLGWKKESSPIPVAAKKEESLLNYPLAKPEIPADLRRWNIVWIVVESWRFDQMNPEITPHIADFSRRALVATNHHSGGNATRFGIFSLFYGVYGTYWHQFLAERRSPVFMDTLQDAGYQFKIMSSTQLSYPEMRSTAFVKIPPEAIEDHLPGNAGPERDPYMAKRFADFLDRREPDRPFFTFMFLDSPHAPYRYPQGYERYRPVADEINYFKVKKTEDPREGLPLFNRYRNAVHFTDSVIGTMLDSLESRGLLKNTLVMITGDHGEEFFERGFLGHNSAFDEYQIQVPFILYVPGMKPRAITRLTSHLDVAPTLMDLMGIKTDPSAYAHGESLLTPERRRPYVVASGWDTFAVIDDKATVVLASESYKAAMTEVRVDGYRLAEQPKPILRERSARLMEVGRDLGNFLR